MAVSLQSLKPIFAKSDIDGNGKLDRAEIAKASLKYLGSNKNQEIGSLFATLAQGGKDKQGLMPDFNNDGFINFNEMKALSGNNKSIGSKDFKAAFGNRFQEGGQDIDLKNLKSLAQKNTSKFQQCAPGFQHSVNDYLLGGNAGNNALGNNGFCNKGPGNNNGLGNNGFGNNNGYGNNGFGNNNGYGNNNGFGNNGYGQSQPPKGGQMMKLMQNVCQLMMTMLNSLMGNQGNSGNFGNFGRAAQNPFS